MSSSTLIPSQDLSRFAMNLTVPWTMGAGKVMPTGTSEPTPSRSMI